MACMQMYEFVIMQSQSLMYQTIPSPALDVLRHQGGEGRVWPLLHCFRGTGWNVDMTNEIQARVMIRNFECT